MEPEGSIIGIDEDYLIEKYFFDNINNVESCINIKILSGYLQHSHTRLERQKRFKKSPA